MLPHVSGVIHVVFVDLPTNGALIRPFLVHVPLVLEKVRVRGELRGAEIAGVRLETEYTINC